MCELIRTQLRKVKTMANSTLNTITYSAPFVTFCKRLAEVYTGQRGWLSLTQESRECGISKTTLQKIAEGDGLVCANHGRYGLIARKK